MDVKCEIDIKKELLEIKEEDESNDQLLEEISFEIKNDPSEIKEEEALNDQPLKEISGLYENQKRNFLPNMNVKCEIEIKDEPLYIKEDERLNDQPLEKFFCKIECDPFDIKKEEDISIDQPLQEISELDENQFFISGVGKEEKDSKAKSTSSKLPSLVTCIQSDKKNLKSLSCKSKECEVTAPTMTDLTAVDPVEVSIEQMSRESQKSGLADDIVTGLVLGTESYSVNNNINMDSTDEEDQDPFYNSDDDEVDSDYNTLNSGSESDSESRDEPATGIEIENANEPITRKRKRGKFNKRTLAKKMRNCGEEYESKTRGRVNKRSMKPPCHNCKLKCTEKIDDNYRKEVFAMFWRMGDLQRQREFIKDSTQAVVPKYQRITLNRKRERGSNQSYSITKNGEKIRVCKQFFKNTFDLSDRAIRTTFEKIDKSTGVLSLEMRGKHGKDRKLDKELVRSAKVHIEKIPRIPSHYCRSQSSREYIDGGKSIAELHRDYIKERKESNLEGISYCQYRAIFKSNNLSFFPPKKDQCDVCLIYQNTKQNTTEYENHILEKNLSRLEKENDKKTTDSTVIAVYDLQAVLSCPQGEASSYYYISKLAVYNLTIAELKGDKTVNCYTWDETQGKRGVIEIGSCVLKYLQHLNDKADCPIDVVFYSDNCWGQQKNNFMMAMYKYAVTTLKNIKSITQKFLVKGHTQNEGDSAFSTIEKEVKRALRSGPIYLPSQYAMAMKTAKKSGKPYLVHELSHEDFFDIKALKDSQVILPMLDIRMFKVIKDNGNFYLKTSYGSHAWEEAKKRNKRGSGSVNPVLMQAYSKRLTIDEKKKKGILKLVTDGIIPSIYSDFYINL